MSLRMNRGCLRGIARLMAGIVLLAQPTVAAYACPLPAASGHAGGDDDRAMSARTDAPAASDTAAMPADCDSMPPMSDELLSNLCAEHCKSGDQSRAQRIRQY